MCRLSTTSSAELWITDPSGAPVATKLASPTGVSGRTRETVATPAAFRVHAQLPPAQRSIAVALQSGATAALLQATARNTPRNSELGRSDGPLSTTGAAQTVDKTRAV